MGPSPCRPRLVEDPGSGNPKSEGGGRLAPPLSGASHGSSLSTFALSGTVLPSGIGSRPAPIFCSAQQNPLRVAGPDCIQPRPPNRDGPSTPPTRSVTTAAFRFISGRTAASLTSACACNGGILIECRCGVLWTHHHLVVRAVLGLFENLLEDRQVRTDRCFVRHNVQVIVEIVRSIVDP